MDLKLYDTLTREKRVFTPLDPGNVRMYVCGPTVYDFAHIGNARPVIVFDVLFRLLRHLAKQGVWDGGKGETTVTYVRNITDVDDKINARAAERLAQRGEPSGDLNAEIRRLTDDTYADFKADVAALGCLPPTVEPRATEHIEEMKALIERLVASDHAYVAEDHVLFFVPSMRDYGKLAKRTLEEMIEGARVEVAPYKRDAMDFVLWKPSKPGEPAWPSPCGIAAPGRPGWHIECSAMSDHWLWTKAEQRLSAAGLAYPHQFDIHGGGADLVFPHHENEIAQSRCGFHTPVMANCWMHNGFLMVEGEKMAKSLGNFVTIRESLTDWHGRSWPGNALRLAMLDTHYHQPINWTYDKVSHAEYELFRFSSGMFALVANCFNKDFAKFGVFLSTASKEVPFEFLEALCNDLNTAGALAYVRQRYAQLDRNPELAVNVVNALDFIGVIRRDFPFLNQPPATLRVFDRNEFETVSELGRELTVALINNDNKQAGVITDRLHDMSISVKQFGFGMFLLEKAVTTAKDVKAEAEIRNLIAARAEARARKDFKEADRIRDELAAMGIVLKDTKDGTTWEVAR